jgi:hypothetical protein
METEETYVSPPDSNNLVLTLEAQGYLLSAGNGQPF